MRSFFSKLLETRGSKSSTLNLIIFKAGLEVWLLKENINLNSRMRHMIAALIEVLFYQRSLEISFSLSQII